MTGNAEHKGKSNKAATIASAILWVAGFVLPFCTPPKWAFYWLSDTLLLVGFFPVMFVYPASWTWIVFGICNAVIGAVLEVGNFLPDNVFPPELLPVKAHMKDFHEPLIWLLLGVLSTVYGVIRLIKNVVVKSRRPAS